MGQREGCAPCLVVSRLPPAARGSRLWVCVGGTPAGLHEGVERVFVAGVSARQRPPVGLPAWACRVWLPGLRTPHGLELGPVSAPACGVPRPWMRRRPRDPRSVPRGRVVGGGGSKLGARRQSSRSCTVSASNASLPSRAAMSGGRLAGVLACWLLGWPVSRLGISSLGGPWAVRSAVCSGTSFRCGGPPASPVVSTVGSLRCGWAGREGGVAA